MLSQTSVRGLIIHAKNSPNAQTIKEVLMLRAISKDLDVILQMFKTKHLHVQMTSSVAPPPCSTYTTNSSCIGNGFGCIWSGNACRTLGCSDYTANSNCTSAYTDDWKTIKICGWNTTCSEA